MCPNATVRFGEARSWRVLGILAFSLAAFGQQPGGDSNPIRPGWRQIGNSALETMLASPSTGPVERVWYSEDGSLLFALTRSGRVFETRDFEAWKLGAAQPPAGGDLDSSRPDSLPDAGGDVRAVRRGGSRFYVLRRHVYRSDDGGRHWMNLTSFRQESIIGGGMSDLAVSPANPDELAVANEHGVWRSLDGGLSWSGLNRSLPNLPLRRILATPAGSRGLTVLLNDAGAAAWAPRQ